MDTDLRFMTATADSDIPIVDLHTVDSRHNALEELDSAIAHFLVSKTYFRVIYGIGEGILAVAVAEYLDASPYVRDWREEESGGSAIVLL